MGPCSEQRAQELAERARDGDVEATGQLLKAVAPGMIRGAQALMGSHRDVDDVIQQSMIALVQALPSFRGESSPSQFAATIVARTALAARRRSKTRDERHEGGVDPDAFESGRPSLTEQLSAERRRCAIRELLEALPEEQAEALALRIVFGFSLSEVAAAAGAPLNTIRSRIRLGKEALRRRITAEPALAELLEVDR